MAVVFQLLSHVQLFVTPWTTARQASLYSLSPWLCSNSCPWSQWCHPTISSFVDSSSCPQSFPASGSFPMNWLLASWPKCWSFSFSTRPSSEYSGLISFRIDWFNLLAVQGTLKSPLQNHSLKETILQCSAFFRVQLPQPYMTTEKTKALTIQTFVSKVISLLFNTLSRFVIALLPRSKCLLISWQQSPSALILEPKKIKSETVSSFPPSICHEVIGADVMIFVFWMIYWCLYTHTHTHIGASLVAQMVKNLPTMQETWVLSLEDPLEKKIATHSCILAWRIPWTEEPGRLQSMESQRVGHNWETNTHTHTHMYFTLYTLNFTCYVSVCCCSVAKSCLTLCNLMDCSTPGFPTGLPYYPLEFVQVVLLSISSSVAPLLLPSIFPSIRIFFSE